MNGLDCFRLFGVIFSFDSHNSLDVVLVFLHVSYFIHVILLWFGCGRLNWLRESIHSSPFLPLHLDSSLRLSTILWTSTLKSFYYIYKSYLTVPTRFCMVKNYFLLLTHFYCLQSPTRWHVSQLLAGAQKQMKCTTEKEINFGSYSWQHRRYKPTRCSVFTPFPNTRRPRWRSYLAALLRGIVCPPITYRRFSQLISLSEENTQSF